MSRSVWLEAGDTAADPTIRGGPGEESMNLCSSFPSRPAALAGCAWPTSQPKHAAGRKTSPEIFSEALQQGSSPL